MGKLHPWSDPCSPAAFWRRLRKPRLVEEKFGVSLVLCSPPQLHQQCRLQAQREEVLRASRFGACRGKTARVINYEEFKKALEELAQKRFKDKSKEEAFEAICQLVAGKEPINVGVTVSASRRRRAGRDGRTGLCPWANAFWGSTGSPQAQVGTGMGMGMVPDSFSPSPERRKPRPWVPWRG